MIANRAFLPLAAGLIAFLLSIARGPTDIFVFDAATYWAGSVALVSGSDWVSVGLLDLRGVMTPFVYALPAAASLILGGTSGTVEVLVFNSTLVALLSSLVIPSVVRSLGGSHPLALLAASVLAGGLLGAFTPYPLMDLWASALLLTALALVLKRKVSLDLVSGLLLGVGANIRPAVLPAVALVVFISLLARRGASWGMLVGVGVAPGAQAFATWLAFGRPSLTPPATSDLTALQSILASYVIRYDTLTPSEPGAPPSITYCSPQMAGIVAEKGYPVTPVDLASLLIGHPLEGINFVLAKIGSALAWSATTPYESFPSSGFQGVSVLVAIVFSAASVLCVVRLAKRGSTHRFAAALILGVNLGSTAVIALSQPETRFALPMLLSSIAAIGASALSPPRPAGSRGGVLLGLQVFAVVGITCVLLLFGEAGLRYPLPAGDGSLETCQAAWGTLD